MSIYDEISKRLDEAKEEHQRLQEMVSKLDDKIDHIRAEDIPEIKVDTERTRSELQADILAVKTELKTDIATMRGRWQAATFLVPLVISIAVNFIGC